ncbi:hypothetical protein ABH994_003041 [Bradyrhizobium yuanmingense]
MKKPPARADWPPLSTMAHCAPKRLQRRTAVPSWSNPDRIAQAPKIPSTQFMLTCKARMTATVVARLTSTFRPCVRFWFKPPLRSASR